jgi:hypothetical protein
LTTDDYLFVRYPVLDGIESRRKEMHDEVGSLTGEQLSSTDDARWCDLLEQKYKFDVPRLLRERIEADTNEIEVDVSGDPNFNPFRNGGPILKKASKITFYVPFEGDGEIFLIRPSQHTLSPPRGSVRQGELVITYVRLDQDGAQARREFDNDLAVIQCHLNWMEASVRQFNISLRGEAENLLAQRRMKLNRDREMDAALGYPLRRRESVPAIYSPPAVKRKLTPPGAAGTPTAAAQVAAHEPFLEMGVYEHILSLLSQMAVVIERSPQAFRTMGEEDIRFVLLVPLNTHYEGRASAEAFNFEGKTDILIRENGKNIFVAECKFWDGPESLRKAMDQILGYTCWRDTKTALLIFNRGRQLSTVLAKIPEVVKQHPNFKRQLEYQSETGSRFVLHHRDDVARDLILTVLVFEVPA